MTTQPARAAASRTTQSKRTAAQGRSAPVLPCACANLRKAAHIATQFYDGVLRPYGIRATQFTLLQALHSAPGISQKKLADILGIDSTTLTRTLNFLREREWLRSEKGLDRRELQLFLAAAGQREYKRMLPHWQSAQKQFRRHVGEENWNRMMDTAVEIARIKPKV